MSSIPDLAQRDDVTRVIGLQTQYTADLIGLPIVEPQLTWQISSERPNEKSHFNTIFVQSNF